MERFVWFNLFECVNCKIVATFKHWNVDDTNLKSSDEFCVFRFVWNEEIKHIRVTQIVLHKNRSV